MRDKTWVTEINSDDPWVHQKQSAITAFDGVVDEIRKNRETIYSKIYFSTSIIAAVLIAIFAEYFNGVIIIALIDTLMLMLIFPARNYYFRRQELAKCKDEIEKKFKEMGIELK